MTPRSPFLLAALTLVAAVAGCKRASATSTAAHRVVSVSPSTTEALFAIGAGDSVVGRSQDSDYPPEASHLPIVADSAKVNLESALSLSPDLVTGARGPGGNGAALSLGAHGVATFFPETETLAQIDELLLGLGERTGHTSEARIVVAHLQASEAAVARDVEGSGKRRVILLFGTKPIVAAGPKSFSNEMLALSGAKNVVTEGGASSSLDIERVIALDPDIILDSTVPLGAHSVVTKDSRDWALVRAVREGHVVAISDESVLRPGPRVAEGLRFLARAIHPGVELR